MVLKGITFCVVTINFADKHPMFWNRIRAIEKLFLSFFFARNLMTLSCEQSCCKSVTNVIKFRKQPANFFTFEES